MSDEGWRGRRPEPTGHYVLMAGETPDVVLARIDERTRGLYEDVAEIKKSLNSNYVSREAFEGLKEKVNLHQKILFSVIGVMCLAIIGALVKGVLSS